MKKLLSVLLIAVLLLSIVVVANAEKSDIELRTLEGTYQVSVTITNPDVANSHLNSFGIKGALPSDIIESDFKVDIKYVNGKYLLYDKADEIKNTGLTTNKEYFIFNFMYEVKNSSMSNLAYEIKADLSFNDSTQSFETITPKNKASLIYKDDGSYSYIGIGDFTMEKISSAPQEEPEEDNGETVFEEEDIPRGITFVKGLVEVKRAGTDNWIRARRNMPLNSGDMVRTGKNSYADLGCSSGEFTQATGSDIMMRPNSIITVPDKTLKVERKSKVRVIMDDAMKNVYSLFGKEEFEIETPSAVCGIRGTDFIVDVDEDGNTTFLLNKGQITVASKHDDTEAIINAGQKITAPVNETLSAMAELTDDDRNEFKVEYEDTNIQEDEENNEGGFFVILIIAATAVAILFLIFMALKKRKR